MSGAGYSYSMPIHLLGSQPGDVPFSRTFFNATLGELIAGEDQRVSLFLVDGTTIDVCSIERLTDSYMALRAYQAGGDTCSMSLQLVPYGAIYRIEITPPKGDGARRVGFHWTRK